MESPLWILSQVSSTAVIFDNQRKGVLFQTKYDSYIYKYKKKAMHKLSIWQNFTGNQILNNLYMYQI